MIVKCPVNLLFINPSPMPYAEQCAFIEEHNTTRIPDLSVPLGFIEMGAYLRRRVDGLNLELLDIGKDLHSVYARYVEGRPTEEMPAKCSDFYREELERVRMQPDIVGLSILYSTSYSSSLEIIRLARNKWPGALLICGGHHATACYKQVLRQSVVDLVFRGEAEISMLEFLKKFQESDRQRIRQSVGAFAKLNGVYDHAKAEAAPRRGGWGICCLILTRLVCRPMTYWI